MRHEDFFAIVDELPRNERGCQLWRRSLTTKGYVQVYLPDGNKWGHRAVLERKLGRKIREGYFALHTCDNKACLAEDHLYEGTKSDNAYDASRRGQLPTGKRHFFHATRILEKDDKTGRFKRRQA